MDVLPVLIGLVVLGLTVAIFEMLPEIIEEFKPFMTITGIFFVVYVSAVVAVYLLHKKSADEVQIVNAPAVIESTPVSVEITP